MKGLAASNLEARMSRCLAKRKSICHNIYCTQPPHAGATKLYCPHHKGAGSPHPIRVEGPDLWYLMALVDTTVEQSLVSSAEGTRGA